jgi:hypothetical protein
MDKGDMMKKLSMGHGPAHSVHVHAPTDIVSKAVAVTLVLRGYRA